MKILRNSLVAIAAILTISVTIAAQAGTIKAKLFPTGTCLTTAAYKTSANIFDPLVANCAGTVQAVTCDEDQIGEFVSSSVQNTTSRPCLGGDELCCVVLSTSTTLCGGVQRQTIADIYCRETAE